MANLQKTVEIIFMGKDQISTPIKNITTKIDKVSASVEMAAAPFGILADGILKVDTAIATLVLGGIAYSAKKFAEFEQTMLTVKGVMQASGPEYESLNNLVKGLGETTKFTAQEAAEGLEFLARAGLKSDEAMIALPETLKLAQAATMDLGETADIVTNIMAGYGVEVEDLGKTNDILTATFTNSNTSLGELGNAFKMVGPVAASMGFSIEETSASLGILANAGYKAEMGGTALRNIMIALVSPAGNMGKLMKELGVDTEELGIDFSSSKNALKSLGVEVKDSSGNILPFSNILEQVKIGLENIKDPADKTAALIEIFGKRGGPQMAALLEQGSGAVSGLEEKIKSLGGITDKISAEMQSGLKGAIDELISAFDSMSISIGEKSKIGIEPALDGASELFRTFSKAIKDDAFKDIFKVLDEFGESAADLLGSMAESLPEALEKVDFDGIVDSLSTLSESIGDMFDGVDVTTPEGLAKVIQEIVDTGESLVLTTSGIIKSFGPMKDTIIGLIKSYNEMDEAEKVSAGELLGLAKQITDFGLKAVAAIAIISESADKLEPIFTTVTNTISGALDAGISTFNMLKLAFLEILDDLLQASLVFSETVLFGAFSDDVEANITKVQEWKEETKKAMYDAASSATEKLTGIQVDFSNLGGSAEDAASKTEKVTEKINEIPEGKQVAVKVELTDEEKVDAELDDFFGDIDAINKNLEIVASMSPDEASIEQTKYEIEHVGTRADGSSITIKVPVEADGIDETKSAIEELPTERQIEIKLQGDIDTELERIKTSAETMQTALEWTAKVDIAEIEAAAEVASSAFDAIGTSVSGMSASVSDMFSTLSTAYSSAGLSISEKWNLEDLMDQQLENETALVESQVAMNEAQTEYMQARSAALESGDDISISVKAEGLQPHLESLWFEVLQALQVQMNESAADMLLSIQGA